MSVGFGVHEQTNRATRWSVSDVVTMAKAISIMAFYFLFCYAFTIAVGGVVFSNNMPDYSPAIPLVFMSLEIALLTLSFHMLKKHTVFIKKAYPFIIVFSISLLFILNVRLGYMLRFEPIFDLGAIYTGAKEWATTGNFLDYMDPSVGYNYFYYFPHNLGGMMLLFVAFKVAAFFGATDYFAVAMITNALLATATVLLVVLICKRLFGIPQSIMALVLVLLSPPFYMIAPVFYTDSLSMVFPALVVYFYLKFYDSTHTAQSVQYAVLIGVSCVIGMLIKFTVIIALIAILIHTILLKGVIPFFRVVAVAGSIVTAVLLAFNMYFYSVHLDSQKADALNIPFSHWVMMSLDDGSFDPEDYDFTLSFTDKYEQKSAIVDRIQERIKEKGLFGMLWLFFYKDIVAFGDSTYGQSDFLDDAPVNETKLHSLVLYEGRYFRRYKYVCSATYFTIQLLMLLSAFSVLLSKKKIYTNMISLLCIFGLMLFFTIWEVDGRYVTNYVSMMIISAVSGLDVIMGMLRGKGTRLKNIHMEWRAGIDESKPFN